MSHYAVEIDLTNRNTSHVQVIELVGTDKRVLDVGCWTGELGHALIQQGNSVVGLEIDTDAAATAAKVLEHVDVADLNVTPLTEIYEPQSFDVVVFADVLEHLVDPVGVLRAAGQLLKQDGYVVISIPNIAHGSVRLALLQGRWHTTETGLLDHTHIKFYSRMGFLELLNGAGFAATDLRGTLADPLRTEVEIDEALLPRGAVEWVRDQPDGLVYQFQAKARPLQEGEVASAPLLKMAEKPSRVRLKDVHADDRAHDQRAESEAQAEIERAQEKVLEAERAVLIMRDHVIGLQAEATAARETTERVRQRLQRLRAKLAERDEEIARLRKLLTPRGLAGHVKRRLTR